MAYELRRNEKGRFYKHFLEASSNGVHTIEKAEEHPEDDITEHIEVTETPMTEDQTDTLVNEEQTPEPQSQPEPKPAATNPVNDTLPPKPKPQTNSLLEELVKPTRKDIQNIGTMAEDMRRESERDDDDDDYDDDDDDTEEAVPVDNKLKKKKAKLKALIQVNSGSIALDKLCCLITGDWNTQKYKISDDEKKMIRDPLTQLNLLKEAKKSSNPGQDLLVSCLLVIIPILLIAASDAFKKNKEKKAEKLKKAEEERLAEHQRILNMYRPPTAIENGAITVSPTSANQNTPAVAVAEKINSEPKKGRHKITCPKHKDKNAECNCKK